MRRTKKLIGWESFSAGKLKSVLIAQPEDLEGICFLLNSREPLELCSELRRLVEVWQKSGPNLGKMRKGDPVLAARVLHGRTHLVPTRTGKGHLLWLPTPHDFDARRWKDHALTAFMDLIVSPQWDKLGGPCVRCQKYYIKKTARQKSFCSRRCGSASTAISKTKQRREAARAQKLLMAQIGIEGWTKGLTEQPWKEWVSKKTKITVKWLTRAVNKAELRSPMRDHP